MTPATLPADATVPAAQARPKSALLRQQPQQHHQGRQCRRGRGRGCRPPRGERGGGQVSIGFLGVAAILFPLLFGIIQYGLWYNAKQGLLGAAQTAVSIDRATSGNGGDGGGISAGTSVATQAGVRNVTLSEVRTATTVTVTASGDADFIIDFPGISHIRQTVTAPVERFTTP